MFGQNFCFVARTLEGRNIYIRRNPGPFTGNLCVENHKKGKGTELNTRD